MLISQRRRKIVYIVLGIIAALSLVQYAVVIVNPLRREGTMELFHLWWNQQRLQFKMRVVDQYGMPAEGFRFTVETRCISPLIFIFPMFGQMRHYYDVKTDANGEIAFRTYVRRTWQVAFAAEKQQEYIMRFWTDKATSWNGDPVANAFKGGVKPSRFANGGQPLNLQIMRHGPTVQHKWIKLEKTIIGKDGATETGDDVFLLSVHLAEERIDLGYTSGDFTIEIRGGMAAYEHWRESFGKSDERKGRQDWNITLRTAPGVGIVGAPFDVITEAPEKPYWHALYYELPICPKPPEGYQAPTPGVIDSPPTEVIGDAAYYKCFFGDPHLSANLFICTQSPRRYYLVRMRIEGGYEAKMGEALNRIGVRISGIYNPSGDRNLWDGEDGLSDVIVGGW